MKRLLFILLIICFISCNEDGPVNNGSDKTVIDKSLTPSNTDINLTTSDGINITIPAGALNSKLDIKVIKMSNPPASTDPKLKIGNNIFKLALNGSLDFNDDIEIRIKYDKSKIQSGLTVLNGVFGIVFIENAWQVVDCEFDIIREEIVIKFNPQGKVNKYNDKLQEENSIIIGDGYSTTDTGNQDSKLLGYIKQCKYITVKADAFVKWSDGDSSYILQGDGSGVDFYPYYIQEHPQIIVWTDNQIDVTAPFLYSEYGFYFHLFGEFNSDGSIKEMTIEFNSQYKLSAKLIVKNVPKDYFDPDGIFDYRNYKIPIQNDPDRKKYVSFFEVTEPIEEKTRTIINVDWNTFQSDITFHLNQ